MVGLTDRDHRVWAVLGPTNTGKTHLAIERMLAHPSGVIGLPLRLLAREVYDRVVAARGAGAAALVTGEERIWPSSARYVVATVEAMPMASSASFLAIDEIQLAADPDRGHIFTDRLLRARGQAETMFLGSDTMRPLMRAMVPGLEVERRERFSKLSYAGARKITKLPRRSAIVAFSAEEVYAIAELIRRHRGGAAVVMGALSPRTRNAQVALYQSGEVDFLVATDAIGMGLNMDVEHVAFASLSKFDGRQMRRLRADEIAQIAGRAGRYTTDGTFGETIDCQPLDPETVDRVENHAFEAQERVMWRTAGLAFDSLEALTHSLEAAPPSPAYARVRGATDEETLRRLAAREAVRDRARTEAQVRRLWELCQLPDFCRSTPDEHAFLCEGLFHHLFGPRGRIPEDFMAREMAKLDRPDGDLEQLHDRLAHIRTWTYAAQRPDWVENAAHWRERARAVEDSLSDLLHERLTQRFIDRRTTALVQGLKREDAALIAVTAEGEVLLEGHLVGRLAGLSFRPDPRGIGLEEKALKAALHRAVRPEIARRLGALTQADDATLALDDDGRLLWDGVFVGRLGPAPDPLLPRVALHGGELGDDAARQRAQARLEAYVAGLATQDLAQLRALETAVRDGALRGLARGIAYRLVEGLGAVEREAVAGDLLALSSADRRALRSLGVRFGRYAVFLPGLLKPRAARLLALLRFHSAGRARDGARPFLPPPGATSLPVETGVSALDYAAAGYRVAGPRAVRVDALEALAEALMSARSAQTFALPVGAASLIGCPAGVFEEVLRALGWRKAKKAEGEAPALWRPPAARPAVKRSPPRARSEAERREEPVLSPFAALAALATPAPKSPRRRRRRRPARRAS